MGLIQEVKWGKFGYYYSMDGTTWNQATCSGWRLAEDIVIVDGNTYQMDSVFQGGQMISNVAQIVALSDSQLYPDNPYKNKCYFEDGNGNRSSSFFTYNNRTITFNISGSEYSYSIPADTDTLTYDFMQFWWKLNDNGTAVDGGICAKVYGGAYVGDTYVYMKKFDASIISAFSNSTSTAQDNFYNVEISKYIDIEDKDFNLLVLNPSYYPENASTNGGTGPSTQQRNNCLIPLVFGSDDYTMVSDPSDTDALQNQLEAFTYATANPDENESDMLRSSDGTASGMFINGFGYDPDTRKQFPFSLKINADTYLYFTSSVNYGLTTIYVYITTDANGTHKYGSGSFESLFAIYSYYAGADDFTNSGLPMNVYLIKLEDHPTLPVGYYMVVRANHLIYDADTSAEIGNRVGYLLCYPQIYNNQGLEYFNQFSAEVESAVISEEIVTDDTPDDVQPVPGEQYDNSTFDDGTIAGHSGSGIPGGDSEKPDPDTPSDASLPDENGNTTGSGSALAMGFVKAFALTLTDGQNLSSEFGTTTFWDEASKYFKNNPLDYIISMHAVPITYANLQTSTRVNLQCGSWTSSNTFAPLSKQRYTKYMGTVNLPEWYGDYNDYRNSRIMIYLPFIGYKDLSVTDCMGRSLALYYNIDALTGEILAYLKSDGLMIYQWSGNAIMQYPLTYSSHNTMINSLIGMAGSIASAGVGIASGNVAQGVVSGLTGIANNVSNVFKDDISRSGTLSSDAGWMGGKRPYIYLLRPQRSQASIVDYKLSQGQPSTFFARIGDLDANSYCKMTSIDTPTGLGCLDAEYDMIVNILKEGFYV